MTSGDMVMFTQAVSEPRIIRPSTGKSRHHASAGQPATSDAALVERVAIGDKAAMQALYARHGLRIYRFILRLTGDATIAEDVLSDVFLDLWRSAARFEQKSQVSTWLLAIARHKALSARRRRQDEQLDERTAATIQDSTDDPETTALKMDRRAILRKCLMRLSPAHREVLDLVYYHDKSVDEAAQIVGVSPSTVKTRMFYARSKMTALLQDAGIDGF
jgi:RNA polymerase sigma-70 factor, ECF subfamily